METSCSLSPVALFAYKRLSHLKRTIDALKRNHLARETELVAFSDAARSLADADAVADVRRYLRTVDGFKTVNIVERRENLGLSASIIDGVTRVVATYGRVIVLEDDMVVSPHFLNYMNDALGIYENETSVISIHGYVYPVVGSLPALFFIRGADCWGWATWKRGWDLFEADGRKLLDQIRGGGLERAFDANGSYPYTDMLERQVEGKNDSWAIRWHASAFLKGGLTLYPGKSLVQNIGNDDSGTHCQKTSVFDIDESACPIVVEQIPIKESNEARIEFERFFRSLRPSLPHRFVEHIRRLKAVLR